MRVEMVSGVFLAIAILLTINGSSGMAALVPRGMENEEVWEAIQYGYVIDPDAPSYLARGDRIFEVTKDESIAVSQNPDMKIDFEYSDSEHTAASKVAASMSVSGNFGAFSAAASMEVSSSSDSSIKTVRMDAVIKAIQYEVASIGAFRTFPERYVTDNFKEAVKTLTVEQIETRIGSFYASRMDLGGEIRKSYTMQATSDDTETSVKSELEASYGGSMMGVTGKAAIGVESRTSNKEASMKIGWSAKGGNTLIWLEKDFSDKDDTSVSNIQTEWAKTINDGNLYPFNYELGLMWELVKKVDMQKGTELQQYLEKKWEANRNLFVPTKFLTVIKCDEGFYQCANGEGCYVETDKCDGGTPQCSDGSDEADCGDYGRSCAWGDGENCDRYYGCSWGCYDSYCWSACNGACAGTANYCSGCKEWCWSSGNGSKWSKCSANDQCTDVHRNSCAGSCSV